MPSRPPLLRLGRWLLVLCCVLAAASLLTVIIALPSGSPASADPGAPVQPWWVILLPAVVGIGLILVLPRRRTPLPVTITDRRRATGSTAALLILAILFPLSVGLFSLGQSEWYVISKALLLMLIPGIVVAVVRGIRIDAAPAGWRWWAPAIVLAVWVLLAEVAPWNPRANLEEFDPAMLIVSAVATAITAGLGEELFYRRWLQTRLEATLGAGPGIALSAVAFGLMHLGSHGTGEPILDIARVIVTQGSFGLFVGLMWWRYRNLAAIVVAHLIINGAQVAYFLLT